MTYDYGSSRSRRAPMGLWIVTVLAVAAIGAVTHYFLDKRAKELAAEARAWTVVGPPCPQVTKAVFDAQPFQARQVTNINGVRWARSSATIMCQGIASDGGRGAVLDPVCQFSSPRVLRITTAKGDFYFVPGLGQKATVTVKDGVATCVMGASVKF